MCRKTVLANSYVSGSVVVARIIVECTCTLFLKFLTDFIVIGFVDGSARKVIQGIFHFIGGIAYEVCGILHLVFDFVEIHDCSDMLDFDFII